MFGPPPSSVQLANLVFASALPSRTRPGRAYLPFFAVSSTDPEATPRLDPARQREASGPSRNVNSPTRAAAALEKIDALRRARELRLRGDDRPDLVGHELLHVPVGECRLELPLRLGHDRVRPERELAPREHDRGGSDLRAVAGRQAETAPATPHCRGGAWRPPRCRRTRRSQRRGPRPSTDSGSGGPSFAFGSRSGGSGNPGISGRFLSRSGVACAASTFCRRRNWIDLGRSAVTRNVRRARVSTS